MADDPEVKIKISTELENDGATPANVLIQQLEAELQKATAQFKAITAQAKEFGAEVQNLTLSAEMTGNEAVIRKVTDALGLSVDQVKALSKGYKDAGLTLKDLASGFEGLAADISSGAISAEKADGDLRLMIDDARWLTDTLQEMGAAFNALDFGRFNAEGMGEALASYEALEAKLGAVADKLTDQRSQLNALANSYEQQRAALDKTAAGYEKQNSALLQAERFYRTQREQISAILPQLDALREKGISALEGMSAGQSGEAATRAIEALGTAADACASKLEAASAKIRLSEKAKLDAIETAAGKAAAAQAQAAAKAEAAAQAQAAAEQKTADAMRVSALSKQELIKLTFELMTARREAAAAGDAERYAALTAQLRNCRAQMAAYTKESSLARIASMQQVQTVGALTSSLGNAVSTFSNLGQAAKDGTLSISGLAGAASMFFTAIKSGMGPLGWALLAIEGLATAYNYVTQNSKKAAEAAEKFAAAQAKLDKEATERAQQATRAIVDAYKERYETAERLAKESTQAAIEQFDAEFNSKEKALQAEIDAIKAKHATELALKEQAAKNGDISAIELEQLRQQYAEEERIAVEALTEIGEQKNAVRLEYERRGNEAALAEAEKTAKAISDKYQEIATAWSSDKSQAAQSLLNALDRVRADREAFTKQLEGIGESLKELKKSNMPEAQKVKEINKLRDKQREIIEQNNELAAQEKDLQWQINNDCKEIIEAVQRTAEGRDLSAAESLRLARNITQEVNEVRNHVDSLRRQKTTLDKQEEAQKQIAQSKRQQAQAENDLLGTRREQALQAAQDKDLQKEIAAALEQIEEGTKYLAEEAKAEGKTEKQIAETNKERARERLRQLVELKKLKITQEGEASKQLAAEIDKTRKEYKKWGDALKKAQLAERYDRISKELADIENALSECSHLEREDNRTRRERLQQDQAILTAQKAAAEAILQRTAAGSAEYDKANGLLAQINDKLAIVKENHEKNAAESAKMLANFQLPDLHAASKQNEKALLALGERSQRLAAQIEKAAEEGNWGQVRILGEQLKRTTDQMNRMGEQGNEGTRIYEQINEHATEIKAAAMRQKKAAQESADAKKREAEANEENAKTAQELAQEKEQQIREQEQEIADLSQEINTLAALIDRMNEQMNGLKESTQKANESLEKCVDAVSLVATFSNQIANCVVTALQDMKKDISQLQTNVDLLKRGIR